MRRAPPTAGQQTARSGEAPAAHPNTGVQVLHNPSILQCIPISPSPGPASTLAPCTLCCWHSSRCLSLILTQSAICRREGWQRKRLNLHLHAASPWLIIQRLNDTVVHHCRRAVLGDGRSLAEAAAAAAAGDAAGSESSFTRPSPFASFRCCRIQMSHHVLAAEETPLAGVQFQACTLCPFLASSQDRVHSLVCPVALWLPTSCRQCCLKACWMCGEVVTPQMDGSCSW